MDPTDPLVQLLTGFVANVASDGVGALARRRQLPHSESELVSNLSLQAQLQDAAVSEHAMISVARFLGTAAAHPLAYSALAYEGRFNPLSQTPQDLIDEVLAYLRLLTDIRPAEIRPCAEVIAQAMRLAASAVLRSDQALATQFRGLPMNQMRLQVPGSLEESRRIPLPDLEATSKFIDRYISSVATATRFGVLQHLEADATPFEDVYIEPQLADWPQPRRSGLHTPASVFRQSLRCVVLGNPGAGKSSLMRFVLHQSSRATVDAQSRIPIYIELRRYFAESANKPQTIREFAEGEIARLYQVRAPEGALEFLLTQGRAAVLFDGLDEVIETRSRLETVSAVESFASMYPACAITVTSRIAGYREAPMEPSHFDHYSIQPFNDESVANYAHAWFRVTSRGRYDSTLRSNHFLEEAKALGSLRTNPLTLSLLCATYLGEGSIPRTRVELYEKCATLLFDRWDALRHISRASAYKGSAREAVLAAAAWIYADESRQTGVHERDLVTFLARHFQKRIPSMEDARSEASDLVSLWRGRAWIITDVAADLDNQPIYRFSHQTFLEYFTAVQLVRTGSASKLLKKLRRRILRGEWEVVNELAVAVLAQYQDGGVDKFISLLLRQTESQRDRLVLLQFAVKAAETVELRAATLLKLLHAIASNFVHLATLPADPFEYFEELTRMRSASDSVDLSAYIDGSYLIATEHATGSMVATADEYELVFFRLLVRLHDRRAVLERYYETVARGVDNVALEGSRQATLLLLLLRAAVPQLNKSVELQLPTPAILPHVRDVIDRRFRDDWMVMAGMQSCGLVSADDLLPLLPWQCFFASTPIMYVSAISFSWSSLLHRHSVARFWDCIPAIGRALLRDGRDGRWPIAPAPVEDAHLIREWVGTEIGWIEVSDESLLSVGTPAVTDIATEAGLFLILAVLAESGQLEEYRVEPARMSHRLKLSTHPWIEEALNRRLRVQSGVSLVPMEGRIPDRLVGLVEAWILQELDFAI